MVRGVGTIFEDRLVKHRVNCPHDGENTIQTPYNFNITSPKFAQVGPKLRHYISLSTFPQQDQAIWSYQWHALQCGQCTTLAKTCRRILYHHTTSNVRLPNSQISFDCAVCDAQHLGLGCLLAGRDRLCDLLTLREAKPIPISQARYIDHFKIQFLDQRP